MKAETTRRPLLPACAKVLRMKWTRPGGAGETSQAAHGFPGTRQNASFRPILGVHLENVGEERIAGRPELVVKLYSEVAGTLGSSLREGLNERFDLQLAQASLGIYDLATIPAVRCELPNELSRVRFVSDNSNTVQVDGSDIRSRFPELGL